MLGAKTVTLLALDERREYRDASFLSSEAKRVVCLELDMRSQSVLLVCGLVWSRGGMCGRCAGGPE